MISVTAACDSKARVTKGPLMLIALDGFSPTPCGTGNWRSIWTDLTVEQLVRWLAVHWGVQRHLIVALRMRSCTQNVLDTADIVRDRDITSNHRFRTSDKIPILSPSANLEWPASLRNFSSPPQPESRIISGEHGLASPKSILLVETHTP